MTSANIVLALVRDGLRARGFRKTKQIYSKRSGGILVGIAVYGSRFAAVYYLDIYINFPTDASEDSVVLSMPPHVMMRIERFFEALALPRLETPIAALNLDFPGDDAERRREIESMLNSLDAGVDQVLESGTPRAPLLKRVASMGIVTTSGYASMGTSLEELKSLRHRDTV